jgi:hypothetical protein
MSQVLVSPTYNPSYSGGESWFEARTRKEFMRPCLAKTHHKKRLVEWLKV